MSDQPISNNNIEIDLDQGRGLDSAPEIKVSKPFDVERHRGVITIRLIAFLAALIFVYFICTTAIVLCDKKVEAIASIFNISLPVVSGLVGSAVAHYFTKTLRS